MEPIIGKSCNGCLQHVGGSTAHIQDSKSSKMVALTNNFSISIASICYATFSGPGTISICNVCIYGQVKYFTHLLVGMYVYGKVIKICHTVHY